METILSNVAFKMCWNIFEHNGTYNTLIQTDDSGMLFSHFIICCWHSNKLIKKSEECSVYLQLQLRNRVESTYLNYYVNKKHFLLGFFCIRKCECVNDICRHTTLTENINSPCLSLHMNVMWILQFLFLPLSCENLTLM